MLFDFENVELSDQYETIGQPISSEPQREFMVALSSLPIVLLTLTTDIVTLDMYGHFRLHKVGSEERLLFRTNKAHLHVLWDEINQATYTIEETKKNGVTRRWQGIYFLANKKRAFSLWLPPNAEDFPKELLLKMDAFNASNVLI